MKELWINGPKMASEAGIFPIGMDAVLLASFSASGKEKHICDIGCGGGILSVLLYEINKKAEIVALDISEKAVNLTKKNAACNAMQDRLHVLHLDIRKWKTALDANAFDLVVCNPPYFKEGAGTPAAVPQARSGTECTVEEICRAAAGLLKNLGRFALSYSPERLPELFIAMANASLEPKRLRFVHHTAAARPSLALVEGRLAAKPRLHVMPPLIVKSEDGSDTPEIEKIYHKSRSGL